MSETIKAGSHRALQRARCGADRITETKRQRFLDMLAASCNVRMAAEAAGATASSFYRLRRREPGFADTWQEAIAIGYHRLEEALLEYALSRVEAEDIDPDRADPEAVARSIVGKLDRRTVSMEDLRFALSLLNRHRAAAEGRARIPRGTHRATAEETDAALRKHLDTLARQLKNHGA